jgi:hypothetical protein
VVSLTCGITGSCRVPLRVLHKKLSCGSESMLRARAFHFLPFLGQEFAEAGVEVGPGGFCMHCRFPARQRRLVVGPQSCFAGSLGSWAPGSGQFLGSEASRGFERHVPLLWTLTTGPHSQNGDLAARGVAEASAKALGRLETETLLRLYSWLWAFRGASDFVPSDATEWHALEQLQRKS